MSEIRHYIMKDGARVSPLLATETDAWKWLLDHQGQSTGYAVTHGGYTYETVRLAAEIAYGTADVEAQCRIEEARLDAYYERLKDRDRFERLTAAGVSAEDAETVIENETAE